MVDDKIFIKYNKDGMHILKVFKLGNPIKYIAEIHMPGIGVINSLRGEKQGKEVFFDFSSFTDPGTIYRIDTDTLKVSKWYS
jgi:prolyl oligopeptidase